MTHFHISHHFNINVRLCTILGAHRFSYKNKENTSSCKSFEIHDVFIHDFILI